ncbi:unnamed protein product [Owenia fusiformis]|uniref:Uncharacterized protein n=1 Tax=Owenia fusiformis TaxID=6347 RepID=A0A8J1XKF2_OWEFU|nr:unnamed protein product [Owenia fusiformis]
MNTYLGFILVCLALTTLGQEDAEVKTCDSSDTEALTKSMNAFAIDLYKEIVKQNKGNDTENVFISPISISMALSMMLLGTAGDTKTQMVETLHLKDTPGDIFHSAYACLKDFLFKDRKAFALQSANKLYRDKTLKVKEPFLESLNKFYDGAIEELDFKDSETSTKIINNWVAEQTMQMIKEVLVPGDIDTMTIMALVNAIYFKGSWVSQFKPENTKERIFHRLDKTTTPVTMMHQPEAFLHVSSPDLKAQILELPYVQEKKDKNAPKLCMDIILPNEKDGLRDTESRLTSELFKEELYFLNAKPVYVDLPRLKLKSRYEISSMLETLGMRDLFSSKVDLTPFSDDPRVDVSKVIHEAVVEMDEKGTEASAVTILTGGRSGISSPVHFTCDHPFIFIIRDTTTNTILFMGRVTNPELRPNIQIDDEPLDLDEPNGDSKRDRRKECKMACRKKCRADCKESMELEKGFKTDAATFLEYKDCKRPCKETCFAACRV